MKGRGLAAKTQCEPLPYYGGIALDVVLCCVVLVDKCLDDPQYVTDVK